jgi:Co/Zn/Cd efflux system component
MIQVMKANYKMLLLTLLALSVTHLANANGKITTQEDSTSAAVAIIIAVCGTIIACLGVYIVRRGHGGSSNLSIKLGEGKELTLTALTQGIVIVLLGIGVLIMGLYRLPSTKKSETIEGKEIKLRPDGKPFAVAE